MNTLQAAAKCQYPARLRSCQRKLAGISFACQWNQKKKENPIYQECSVFVVINVEMALFKITFGKFLNPGLQTRGLKRNKNNNFIKSDFQLLLDIFFFSSKFSAQQICWLVLSLYKQPNIKPANASHYLKCSCDKKRGRGASQIKKRDLSMQNKCKHKMFKFVFYLESCQLVSSVYHSSLLSKLWYTGYKQESPLLKSCQRQQLVNQNGCCCLISRLICSPGNKLQSTSLTESFRC